MTLAGAFRRNSDKTLKYSRSKWGNMLVLFFLIVMGLFMSIPLIYSVMSSIKPLDELYVFPPRFFVRRPTMNNFRTLFNLVADFWVPFSRYLFNSVFVSAITTVGHVVIASMAAYPLAKFNLKVRWLFNVVVLTLLFNATVLWLPMYLVMSQIGVVNTYFVYILPVLPMPLGLFLMKQFMEKIPMAIIEAAKIDGAGSMKTFWRIAMPQVKPAWLTLIVFSFQSVWNQQPLGLQVFDEDLKLVNMIMPSIVSGGLARMGAASAVGLLMMVPPLLIFLFTQSSVIETMSTSGIK